MTVHAALWMSEQVEALVFPAVLRDHLRTLCGEDPIRLPAEPSDAQLQNVEVLITGWGVPSITPDLLDRLPALHAVVHTGGSVRFLSEDAWHRNITVTSAADANARPVAEFTLGSILLAGKEAFWVAKKYQHMRDFVNRELVLPHSGNNGRRIGIVGASRIGRRVIELLQPFDFDVALYDPFCAASDADSLGVHLHRDLAGLAAASDILSIHAPDLPVTRGMISADVLASLPDGAVLINTARGALVDQEALLAQVRSGRIRALLDVTEPEVLPTEHPLWEVPGAVLTPHIAGATGNEIQRLGAAAVRDLEHILSGDTPPGTVPLALRQTAA